MLGGSSFGAGGLEASAQEHGLRKQSGEKSPPQEPKVLVWDTYRLRGLGPLLALALLGAWQASGGRGRGRP